MHNKTPGRKAQKTVYAACRKERESTLFLLLGQVRDNGSFDVFIAMETITDWHITLCNRFEGKIEK